MRTHKSKRVEIKIKMLKRNYMYIIGRNKYLALHWDQAATSHQPPARVAAAAWCQSSVMPKQRNRESRERVRGKQQKRFWWRRWMQWNCVAPHWWFKERTDQRINGVISVNENTHTCTRTYKCSSLVLCKQNGICAQTEMQITVLEYTSIILYHDVCVRARGWVTLLWPVCAFLGIQFRAKCISF